MTLKNNRAPLLSNIKLYASFHHHMWIQTGVTVRKRLSWVVTSVTLTSDLWPWPLPFAWTSLLSLVITPENFMMIRWWEHSQKGVTDRQTDGKYHSLSCLVAAKNNRAPLLYYIKPCVSFQIHRWIQTEVTLLKRSIRVEIGDFLSLVTLKFDGWPWKTTGHLFHTTSSFVHHFKSIGELKVKLQSRNVQFGSKLAIFCPVWPWNLTDALEKQ